MPPLAEWEQANPETTYDLELFRRDILPRLAGVKLSEIVEATGLSKSYASQVRAGKFHTARVDLAGLRRAGRSNAARTVRSMTERSPMAECPRLVVVRTSPCRCLAEAVASAGTPVVQGEGAGPKGLRGSE
jgi:hypothetical protein